jgi:hypothetical protein
MCLMLMWEGRMPVSCGADSHKTTMHKAADDGSSCHSIRVIISFVKSITLLLELWYRFTHAAQIHH